MLTLRCFPSSKVPWISNSMQAVSNRFVRISNLFLQQFDGCGNWGNWRQISGRDLPHWSIVCLFHFCIHCFVWFKPPNIADSVCRNPWRPRQPTKYQNCCRHQLFLFTSSNCWVALGAHCAVLLGHHRRRGPWWVWPRGWVAYAISFCLAYSMCSCFRVWWHYEQTFFPNRLCVI